MHEDWGNKRDDPKLREKLGSVQSALGEGKHFIDVASAALEQILARTVAMDEFAFGNRNRGQQKTIEEYQEKEREARNAIRVMVEKDRQQTGTIESLRGQVIELQGKIHEANEAVIAKDLQLQEAGKAIKEHLRTIGEKEKETAQVAKYLRDADKRAADQSRMAGEWKRCALQMFFSTADVSKLELPRFSWDLIRDVTKAGSLPYVYLNEKELYTLGQLFPQDTDARRDRLIDTIEEAEEGSVWTAEDALKFLAILRFVHDHFDLTYPDEMWLENALAGRPNWNYSQPDEEPVQDEDFDLEPDEEAEEDAAYLHWNKARLIGKMDDGTPVYYRPKGERVESVADPHASSRGVLRFPRDDGSMAEYLVKADGKLYPVDGQDVSSVPLAVKEMKAAIEASLRAVAAQHSRDLAGEE